ncbi:PqqD family peptide modification chaperone [bacterium]|nr:PqqD family peptide modification chaperone [bacterium]
MRQSARVDGRGPAALLPYRVIPRTTVQSDWDRAGERLELLIPRYKGPLFDRMLHRWTAPERRWIRVPLDRRGSRIYHLIDGYRTAADLVDIYREQYPDDADQIEGRVLRFLLTLQQHGYLDLKRI